MTPVPSPPPTPAATPSRYSSLNYQVAITLRISGRSSGFTWSGTTVTSLPVTLSPLRAGDDRLRAEADARQQFSGTYTSTGTGCTSGPWIGSSGVPFGLSYLHSDGRVRFDYLTASGSRHPAQQTPAFDPYCNEALSPLIADVYATISPRITAVTFPLNGGSMPLSGRTAAFNVSYDGSLTITLTSSTP